MSDDNAPKIILNVRISPQIRADLDRVIAYGPYRIAITALVERGITLAIQELDELAKKLKE